MIETHLEKLQTTLEQATGLPEDTRNELLSLVAAMRSETAGGGESTSTPSETEITGLMASVEKLEASHPEVAALINQVAIALSRMGI